MRATVRKGSGKNETICVQMCTEEVTTNAVPAFKDGKQALYISKLMLIKMAHKDWTAIDRQWITSQAKHLRLMMPAACHFGAEGSVVAGKLQAAENLCFGAADPDPPELSFGTDIPLPVAEAVAHALEQAVPGTREGDLELVSVHLHPAEQGADTRRLQVTVSLDDSGRRLGVLTDMPVAGAAAASHVVDSDSVEADLSVLRGSLALLLSLARPEKDPQEFRCAISRA